MRDVLFVILGFLLGWLVTHIYAVRAERQARTAADILEQQLRDSARRAEEQLRRFQNEVYRIMRTFALIAEQQGLVEWTRDNDGQITFGRVIQAYGMTSIGFGHSAELSAGPATAQGEGEVIPKDSNDKG